MPAEDIVSSPPAIVFTSMRIHKRFDPHTVVKIEPFRTGQVPQTHVYIADSIIDGEGALVKGERILREDMIQPRVSSGP